MSVQQTVVRLGSAAIACAIGASLVLQAGINARLGEKLGPCLTFAVFESSSSRLKLNATTGWHVVHRESRVRFGNFLPPWLADLGCAASNIRPTIVEMAAHFGAAVSGCPLLRVEIRCNDCPMCDDAFSEFKPIPRKLMYLGGAFGVVYVTSTIYLSPIIGFGLFFTAMVFGQMFASNVYDHISFLGVPRHPFTVVKAVIFLPAIAGLALLVRCASGFQFEIGPMA